MTPTTEDELVASVHGYGGPAPGTVDVWWAALAQLRPTHETLLDLAERRRAAAYARRTDRERCVLGAVLVRIVAGAALDRHPRSVRINRRCPECGEQHGRPRVVDAPWDVSVSHSGEHVLVALHHGPVGVDVEIVSDRAASGADLHRLVLAPPERGRAPRGELGGRELIAHWVLKEAALKATGSGLRTPMDRIVVPPEDTVRGRVHLLDTPDRPAWGVRLPAPADCLAAVVTLTAEAPLVRVLRTERGPVPLPA